MTLETAFSLPGIGLELKITVSPGFDLNLPVHVGRHPGQGRHGLALASGGDQEPSARRDNSSSVSISMRVFSGMFKIAKLRGCRDDVYHTPALDNHFSSIFISRIDDLLHTVHVGSECGDDDTGILMLRKNIVEGLSHGALGHGKARPLRVGAVAHQSQNAFLSQLSQNAADRWHHRIPAYSPP